MKTLVVFAIAIIYAHAAALQGDVRIIEQTYDQEPDSSKFKSALETSDGTRVEAFGHLEADAEGNAGINIDGSVKYVAPDGSVQAWTYNSGPQGYVAQGDGIPVAPPSPASVIRLVQYLESNQQKP